MSDILIATPGAARFAEALGSLPAGVTLAIAENTAEAIERAGNASVLIGMPRTVTQAVIDAAPRLEWFQLLTAGSDLVAALRLPPDCALTTVRGSHGPQIAELIFFYMLAFLRDARGIFARQAGEKWQPAPQPLLLWRKLVIIGVGSISEALAQRASAFGMEVIGLSGSRSEAPHFKQIRPLDELAHSMGDADFVVVLTPYRETTRHLIDRDVLAAMQPHAILINVSRGPVVDEAALIDALERRAIGGAALDVFEREPLPSGSPLWHLDNVIVTPHIGGFSAVLPRQLAPLLADNIARWFASPRQPLRNLVARASA